MPAGITGATDEPLLEVAVVAIANVPDIDPREGEDPVPEPRLKFYALIGIDRERVVGSGTPGSIERELARLAVVFLPSVHTHRDGQIARRARGRDDGRLPAAALDENEPVHATEDRRNGVRDGVFRAGTEQHGGKDFHGNSLSGEAFRRKIAAGSGRKASNPRCPRKTHTAE